MIRSFASRLSRALPASSPHPNPAMRSASRTLRRLHRLEMRLRGHPAEARYRFCIDILQGPSPLRLRSVSTGAPALTAASVSDVPAAFVADPFMLRRADGWHMFFEVLNAERNLGEIAHAFSLDGTTWSYDRIVLRDELHLSYPHLLEDDGQIFMLPECWAAGELRLYRATCFPHEWEVAAVLLDRSGAEPTVFTHDGRWWMFLETAPTWGYDRLRLYSAQRLTGPWQEHPASPIVDGNARIARPAGRVVHHEGRLLRFAQDCVPEYGMMVNAIEITELTPDRYAERWLHTNPVVQPGPEPWRRHGAHHIDAHEMEDGRWIACVDLR